MTPRPAAPTAAAAVGSAVESLVHDRRRLLFVAAAGLILALLLLGVAAASGGGDNSNPRQALADEIRTVAANLTTKDGAATKDAKTQLGAVADSVEKGNGAAAASSFLRQLGAWRDGGKLVPAAVDRIAAVLFKVPGVQKDALPPPTTIAPPTTQPPAPAADEGGTKRNKKDKGNHDD
jgi:hypothetical protein